MMMKKDIRQLTQAELTDFFIEKGEKKFRAKQVYEWLWQKSARSFSEMTNLSKDLRARLEQDFLLTPIHPDKVQHSNDGTIKTRFKLHDAHLVESVLIPVASENRFTVCVSSQVGCSLTCSFCATGRMERKRNLNAGEIYDQVAIVNQQSLEKFGHPLTKRRITVSTAGIAKMIKKLADDEVKFNLALSLHAADDEKRNEIMPINESNNLETLMEALKYFYHKTRNRITYEYIAFDNFNDSIGDAKRLTKLCKHFPVKVNIIEYNPIDNAPFINSGEDRLDVFARHLQNNGVQVTIRRSRGRDIDAACGQLANKE